MRKHITERQSLNRFILDSFCVEEISEHIHCEQRGAGKGSCDNQKKALLCINALGFQFHTPTLTYDFSS